MRNKIYLLLSFILFNGMCFAQKTQPNIVLIITDQHSGAIMSQRGYPYIQTPGIDKLADNGVMFTRSYCTYPVCTASRKSFMTGVMPSKLEDVTVKPSIASVLSSAGYETAYYGKWHVGTTDMDEVKDWHGFETYIDGHDDTEIASWSRDFLKKDHAKPFFLISSFLNPHDACEYARNLAGDDDKYHDGAVDELVDTALCPPLPYNFAIPQNEAEGFSGRRYQDPDDNYWSAHPTKLWEESDWRRYMWGYDRLVEKVDAHINQLYEELQNQGLLENTVIIYTSDHGDGHAAHQWNQKKTFYEESVSVPLIISWKGKVKAGVMDEETLVSNGLDIYPTILKMAGVAIPASLHGKDLSPNFMVDNGGEELLSRDYVVSEIEQKIYKSNTPGSFNGRMLVTDRFKYILFDKGLNNEQLFDLQEDPGELKPVTYDPAYQDELLACRDMLREWVINTNDNFDVNKSICLKHLVATRLNNKQPIIYQDMFTELGASDYEGSNINGPSVIRIPDWIAPEHRADPSAQYYCYFAHHDGEYIRMAWATEIEGPWHLYQVGTGVAIGDRGVIDHGKKDIFLKNGIRIEQNHLASPDVHVDHENQRIVLYFHTGPSTFVDDKELKGQYSYVSYSPYGLDFYDNIQSVFFGPSYFRVFNYKDNLFALTNNGTPYRALDANDPWTAPNDYNYSKQLWEKHPNNPFQKAITEYLGLSSDELRVRHTAVRLVGDELQVFYSRRGDLIENVQMVRVDLSGDDWTQWTTSWPPETVLQAIAGWEGGELTPANSETSSAPQDVNQLRDPFVFEDSDGAMYLFYTGRGEDAIGVASLIPTSAECCNWPSEPLGLSAKAISKTEITLKWINGGGNEEGFKVERKTGDTHFEEIAVLGANVASYRDTDLSSGTAYAYRVMAFNATGNSDYSNESIVYTFAEDSEKRQFFVTEDAYVRGGESADENFGNEEELRIKVGNKEDFFRKSLLKFDFTSEDLDPMDIGQAFLRLYASKADASTLALSEIDDQWNEASVVWENAPENGPRISASEISSSDVYYEWDLTDYLKRELAVDRIISCVLEDAIASGGDLRFNSKEAGRNIPEIEIVTTGSLPQNLMHYSANEQILSLYPNPANERLHVKLNHGTINKLRVYDLTGNILMQQKGERGESQLDVEPLSDGIYLIKVESGANNYTLRFVKGK